MFLLKVEMMNFAEILQLLDPIGNFLSERVCLA